MSMTDHEAAEFITEAVWAEAENRGQEYATTSYEDGGVMTNNAGFTMTIDGAEFQVTVVRSR